MRERTVVARAGASADAGFRRLAAQAYGRTRADVELVRPLAFLDRDPAVRREGVIALGAAVRPVRPEPQTRYEAGFEVSREGEAQLVAAWLRDRLRPGGQSGGRIPPGLERDDGVIAVVLETLGGVPDADDGSRQLTEALLVEFLPRVGSPQRLLGAVKGLEAFIRQGGRRAVRPETIERLREVALHPTSGQPFDPDAGPGRTVGDLDLFARARRAAMLALAGARDMDVGTVLAAAGDADWQVRRLAVARMSADRQEFAGALDAALRDRAFQVRLEAVRVVGRLAARTGECGALIRAIDDKAPAVAMAAMDQLHAACEGQQEWLPALVDLASELRFGPSPEAWHEPARALVAVARIAPDRALPLLEAAAAHAVWQVRSASVSAAESLRKEATLIELARDREANVRTAALQALRAIESPALVDASLEALRSDDYELVLTAARLLEHAPVDRRAEASTTLLFTLGRLTDQLSDTARDPRVAILERLGELMDPAQASSLISYFVDFDPKVVDAAIEAFEALNGAPVAFAGNARYRYPHQPAVAALASLPAVALIRMEGGGAIELEFLPDVAPVAVARFAELVRSGYYNGLTFHRVVPNFVIQGGSPGANEYSGVPRYLRDEIGAANVRGTVGLSTRGRDTGDGQLYINLVDNPRLDGDYTVFARVASGMDVVDRILPGARIETVTLR